MDADDRPSRQRALPVRRSGGAVSEAPDVARSVERVVDRARDVFHDQARLWRLEALEAAQRVTRGAAGLVAGAAFGALAWVAAMMALYEWLIAWTAPELSLLLVALLNAAIALAATHVGRRALMRRDTGGEHRP